MRTVRFTQSMMPYRRGDLAGFEDAVAERLIRKGFAEPVLGEDQDIATAEERPAEPRGRRARTDDSA